MQLPHSHNVEDKTHQRSLSVEVMFQYKIKDNDPFEFSEYQPQRRYEASSQKKKIQQPPTKRGNYMDYQLKVASGIPSSQQYQQIRVWSARSANSPKIDFKLKKHSYLDLIENEQKLRKTPAPGDYNLAASEKQLSEEQKKNDKRCQKRNISVLRHFYQDVEHLSILNPGPGNYNPRPIMRKLKPSKKDYTFWIQKHKTQSKSSLSKCKEVPDCSTYSPIPLDVNTFERYSKEKKRPKKNKITVKPWGTGERFSYSVRRSKSASNSIQKRPQPGTYDLILDWPAKPHPNIKRKQHPVDWINKLSHSTARVYH